MLQVGLEPTIPAFERAKTAHALDRAATVTGSLPSHSINTFYKYLNAVEHALFSSECGTYCMDQNMVKRGSQSGNAPRVCFSRYGIV
jgi:hypothetical protein